MGTRMPEAPSSKGTCGSEIPGLGGQTASLAAKRVSGLRKGDRVLLPQHHTHTCAHKYLRVHMRVRPHAVHMHTLSPEVELPPCQALGGPSSSPPQRGQSPQQPPVSSAESPPSGSRSYWHHVCFRGPRGERAGAWGSREGGRSCPEVWPGVPASQAPGTS